jgi:hypothetical protein
MARTRLRDAASIPLLYLVVSGLVLWPLVLHPTAIPARPGNQETDLLLTHLPNAIYLRGALTTYGQWPLWNAQIVAGQPFAADPLAGLWYPPNWLLLAPGLPVVTGFNGLFIFHLAGAGYGVYRLLRSVGQRRGPAIFGGLLFTAGPKLVAHLGAGHVSLVYSVAWTPWMLLAIRRVMQRADGRSAVELALSGALMFLADVRWPYYAGPLAMVYGVTVWCTRDLIQSRPRAARVAATLLLSGVLAIALTAILWLPLVEFVSLSERSSLTLAETAVYSLPPWPYLLGIFIPFYGIIHEWVVYAGFAPAILALLAAPRQRMWAGVAVVAGLFALGSYAFVYPLAVQIVPGLGLLRVPARAWFVVSLAVCLLAAHGVDRVSAWMLARPRLAGYEPIMLPVLAIVTALDLAQMNRSLLVARPIPAPVPAAEWLLAQSGLFRVFSPSGSLPLPDGLQHLEGVAPVRLAQLANFVAHASGIQPRGYSVSVPAVITPHPDNPPDLDGEQLGLLNVRFVITEYDLLIAGFSLRQQFGQTRLYENEFARPRAWSDWGDANVVEWSPNRIVIEADGPGQLVLSEMSYPGWRAHRSGEPVPIEPVAGLLRGVPLAPGPQVITFDFQPVTIYVGAVISLLGLALLSGVWRWKR